MNIFIIDANFYFKPGLRFCLFIYSRRIYKYESIDLNS